MVHGPQTRRMMQLPTPLTLATDASLARIAGLPPGPDRLERQLRQLAKWRSAVLANTIVAKDGAQVRHGPFAGMEYPVSAAEGGRAPRLLGVYEASLYPVIETVIARGYPRIIDIGCAEGYYAVGLARRMPGADICAHDANPAARALCAELAQANAVDGRVTIGGAITHADFAFCSGAPTFILCDIEGAERDLLCPVRAPGLAAADILVEVHEGMYPGLVATLSARFAATHHVRRIDRELRPDLLPGWAATLSDLDRLLLLWEWRSSPTPWLWMERR
jgi:hypothetical protein